MAEDQHGSVKKRKLQEILQCPVCLTIPRGGPITQVCDGGHFTCPTCTNLNNPCPVCRAPPNPAKRLRALVLEQLIEAADFKYGCKHPTCDFFDHKKNLVPHEKECTLRLVPCPDDPCDQEIPFARVIDHLRENRNTVSRIVALGSSRPIEFDIDSITFLNDGEDVLFDRSEILECQGNKFLPAFTRKGTIYCAWVYILGNLEDAGHFFGTISIGEGTDSVICKSGRVFPIDMKRVDIIKEQKGVLKFSHDTESYFTDIESGEYKRINVSFKITRAPSTLPKLVLHDESLVKLDQARFSSSTSAQMRDDVDRRLCDMIMKELNDGVHKELITKILSRHPEINPKRHNYFLAMNDMRPFGGFYAGPYRASSLEGMLKIGRNEAFMVTSPGPRSTSFSNFMDLTMKENNQQMKFLLLTFSHDWNRSIESTECNDLCKMYQDYCLEPELLIQIILQMTKRNRGPSTSRDCAVMDRLSEDINPATYEMAEAFYLKKRRTAR